MCPINPETLPILNLCITPTYSKLLCCIIYTTLYLCCVHIRINNYNLCTHNPVVYTTDDSTQMEWMNDRRVSLICALNRPTAPCVPKSPAHQHKSVTRQTTMTKKIESLNFRCPRNHEIRKMSVKYLFCLSWNRNHSNQWRREMTHSRSSPQQQKEFIMYAEVLHKNMRKLQKYLFRLFPRLNKLTKSCSSPDINLFLFAQTWNEWNAHFPGIFTLIVLYLDSFQMQSSGAAVSLLTTPKSTYKLLINSKLINSNKLNQFLN